MDEARASETFLMDLRKGLGRRLYAATIDMLTVSVGCYAVIQASGDLLPGGVRAARGAALIIMGILFLIEAVTGRSLGKICTGLHLNRTFGGRPMMWQTAVRAIVRWLAPLVALTSVFTKDITTASLLIGGALTLVICEVPSCYISLFRTGGTIFDLAAGTRVQMAV